MVSSTEYLRRVHPIVMRNYRDEKTFGVGPLELGYCIRAAYKMAQILQREGKKPYLVMVYDAGLREVMGVKGDNGFHDYNDKMPENSFLPPSLQEGGVDPWYWHFICCDREGGFFSRLFHRSKKDLVYCPILEDPVKRGEYTQKAFKKKIKTRALISPLVSSIITGKIIKKG